MELRTRIVAIAGVLLVGIVLALPFRKSPRAASPDKNPIAKSRQLSQPRPATAKLSLPVAELPSDSTTHTTDFRPTSSPGRLPPGPSKRDAHRIAPFSFRPYGVNHPTETPASRDPTATVSQASAVEPSLPKSLPAAQAVSRTPDAAAFWPPQRSRISRITASPSTPRLHRVVDGDNLHQLAKDYLGSSDYFLLIYEHNRELLSSPYVLPIGVELAIPRAADINRPSS